MKCYLCDNEDVKKSFIGSTPYYSCAVCGLDFVPEFGSEKDFLTNYRKHHESADDDQTVAKRREQYATDLVKIKKHLASGMVLDVGCSTGEFSNVIQSNSELKVTGIDLDASAIESARTNFPGCVFIETDIENFDSSQKYDAIIFRGVFQYLDSNLQPTFQKALNFLRPGGFVFVFSAPHADAITFKLMKERWHFFEPIEHKLFLRYKSVEYLAGKYNLDIVDLSFPYIDTAYCDIEKNYTDLIQLCQSPDAYEGPTPAFYGNIIEIILKK